MPAGARHTPTNAEEAGRVQVLFFCDQTAERHLPSHFWKLYGHVLREYGIDGRVCAFSHAPDAPAARRLAEETGVRLFRKPSGGIVARLWHNFRLPVLAYRAARPFSKDGAQVYVPHNDAVLALSLWVFARLTGRRVVLFSTHLQAETYAIGKGPLHRSVAAVAKALRGWIMRRVDRVVAMSDEMARILTREAGVPAGRITVMNSVVDMSRALPRAECDPIVEGLRGRMAAKPVDHWMVYAGSINEARGTDFLAATLAAARRRSPRTGLLVLGVAHSPRAKQRLLDRIAADGGEEAFLWADAVPERCLSQCLAVADVGLSPFDPNSIFRVNSPLKNLDYILGGIRVVASPTPENIHVVEGTGFGRIADYTPEAFAEAAVALGDEGPVTSAARERAQRWVAANRSFESASPIWRRILVPAEAG